METKDYLTNYYERYDEDGRLISKHGMVYCRNQHLSLCRKNSMMKGTRFSENSTGRSYKDDHNPFCNRRPKGMKGASS